MNTNAWDDICLVFEKRGRAKYISHLDLVRVFTRALRRSALPLWYTQGFHPHLYLCFPLPLSLGQEGLAEPLEIRLLKSAAEDAPNAFSLEEVPGRVNAALPPEIRVLSAVPSAGKTFTHALYHIALPFSDAYAAQSWAETAQAALRDGGLSAIKIGKQAHRRIEKQIALDERILSAEIFLQEKTVLLDCALLAGGQMSLNPRLLLDALFNKIPDTKPLDFSIVRTRCCYGEGEANESVEGEAGLFPLVV
jgi:radical SAM-linked protein